MTQTIKNQTIRYAQDSIRKRMEETEHIASSFKQGYSEYSEKIGMTLFKAVMLGILIVGILFLAMPYLLQEALPYLDMENTAIIAVAALVLIVIFLSCLLVKYGTILHKIGRVNRRVEQAKMLHSELSKRYDSVEQVAERIETYISNGATIALTAEAEVDLDVQMDELQRLAKGYSERSSAALDMVIKSMYWVSICAYTFAFLYIGFYPIGSLLNTFLDISGQFLGIGYLILALASAVFLQIFMIKNGSTMNPGGYALSLLCPPVVAPIWGVLVGLVMLAIAILAAVAAVALVIAIVAFIISCLNG